VEKELIINASSTEVEIAMLENEKLVEIHKDKTNSNFTVGDIFLGSVKKLMPGLNAAFVDIDHKKDAFLHYTDLGPKLQSLQKFVRGSIAGSQQTELLQDFKIEPEIQKNGKINEVLEKRQPILVQILKEPISTKGPRLSCEVTIPGRYIVLSPFNDVIAVSKKIRSSDERKRLQKLIESIKPANFGVIVRTASEGKGVADLHNELRELMGKWKHIYGQLHQAKAPMKLLSELDKSSSILRDLLTDSFNKILVNDKELYKSLKGYLSDIAPEQRKIINYYGGAQPIFDKFGVTRQIKGAFGKTSTMPSGAYLVIEHTEAMHVVDVNSGPKSRSSDQESTALSVNLEAAEEIARQLRLRDIGGLIVVDFIDMRKHENRKKLFATLKEHMAKDRAQHTILPVSKFGLVQITRQRVRPAVKISTSESCPACNGTGKVNATILVTDEVERDLEFILQSRPKTKLKLELHPFIEAYLKKGLPSTQMKWYLKYGKWVKIKPNTDLPLMDYHFYDGNDDEIRLN
jgi:ribonuclease G